MTSEQDYRQYWLEFVESRFPDVDSSALQLMEDMRYAAHSVFQVGEDSTSRVGISFAQYRILTLLLTYELSGRKEGLAPSEISDHRKTSRNTISALIRSLEDDGYIERRIDQSDRRRFLILLTDQGRELVEENIGRHLEMLSEVFSVFSSEEMQALSSYLHKLQRQAADIKRQTQTT